MANQDPNTLVLNQILSELQKLNNYEQQAARQTQSLTQVNTANAQTPVSAGLIRQAGAGAQLPGGLGSSASTPDLLDQDALQQFTRQQLNQASDEQTGGQTPGPQEAVAWSLLSEAGHGGLLGNVRQAQYSVGRNLGVVGGLGTAASNWQDKLQVNAASQAAAAGGSTFGSNVLSTASQALQPLVTAGGAAQNLVNNHELATTIASMSVASGRNMANNWYEMAAAMGFDPTQYGLVGGAGQSATNIGVTRAGEQVSQLITQLRGFGGANGGAAGARVGQGLTQADAQALVGELFNQGYTPTGTGGVAGGNMGEIASGLAPAVHAMGQQGAEIATSWTQGLRSANDSLSDLTRMLEQIPAAAQASQLGLQGFNQAMQQVASTVTSMGGTSTEAQQMSLNFEQQYPGVSPQDLSGILSSPIVQAFGLGQGVLPSGLSSLSGGQFNNITQGAVQMVMGALSGLAPTQQYTTLANGQRVKLNDPQAMVAQQAASQFFPGVNPQDLLKILNQSPQRQQSIGQLQTLLGSNLGPGSLTGLVGLTGGGSQQDWTTLTQAQKNEATQYWNQKINPLLSQTQSGSQIAYMNQTGNIAKRMQELNNNLFGASGQGANQAGNAATVQISIGLQGKAAQFLTASASQKGQAKAVQNAGGTQLNVTLNSVLGQNPTYAGIPNMVANTGATGP